MRALLVLLASFGLHGAFANGGNDEVVQQHLGIGYVQKHHDNYYHSNKT